MKAIDPVGVDGGGGIPEITVLCPYCGEPVLMKRHPDRPWRLVAAAGCKGSKPLPFLETNIPVDIEEGEEEPVGLSVGEPLEEQPEEGEAESETI